MPELGVNIDHIATLRQQRGGDDPDILLAARTCVASGADSIVVHLREDRRHIQDRDVRLLRRGLETRLNLEMSVAPEIISFACDIKPDQATLVPERRRELTTEGGLDVARLTRRVARAAETLTRRGIEVSLFIEPDIRQIRASKEAGVGIIELHTGRYADAKTPAARSRRLIVLKKATDTALELGLTVNAGHGLDYDNVCPVAHIPGIHELNIGYSIICYAVFSGLSTAVRQMKGLISEGRR